MVNTCKDCKWWSMATRYNEAWHPRPCLVDPPFDLSRTNGFYAYCPNDEGEESAKLETGPDFGCIHWEKKDD